MDILNLLSPQGDTVFYTEDFRTMLKSHYNYILSRPNTHVMALESFEAYKYEFDLFGVLDFKNIPKQYHWIIMVINNYTAPEQFDRNKLNLVIPAFSDIELLKSVYMQRQNIL